MANERYPAPPAIALRKETQFVKMGRYQGYRFHSRQPCIPYLANVGPVSREMLDSIDAWLVDLYAELIDS